jgi:uncharacterized membrane protein YidH (DUF202 family)
MKPTMPTRVGSLSRRLQILFAVSIAVLLLGLWRAPERTWLALLLGSFAMVGFGLSGIFFVALQYATGAKWSIPLRRVGEALSKVLPWGGVGILAVLVLHPSLYPWYGHAFESSEGWMGFKQTWLSYPFFLDRAVIFLAIWLLFAGTIRRNSERQDQERGMTLTRKNTRLSVAFMVVFGITFWLATTDWIMSLEPDWGSTIFGIYQFAGMFVSGLALVSLLTLGLRAASPLRQGVRDAQLLDLGRMIVAFATFWGYIWFSQFMLIWYANLSEETPYMVLRTNSAWGGLFIANLLLNWAIPFLLLLPRVNKMNPRTLATASVIVLVGRLVDLYLMIVPPFSRTRSWPTLWDLAMLAAVASGLLLVTLRSFFAREPLPVGDPYLLRTLEEHA